LSDAGSWDERSLSNADANNSNYALLAFVMVCAS